MDREYKRIENELSEPDMAAYLDITANSYSRIERGEVKCDLPKLFIICQMLDISADYILFGKAKNNDGLTQEQSDRWLSMASFQALEPGNLSRFRI